MCMEGGQKDPSGRILLKVAEADVRESKLFDVEHKSFKAGASSGNRPTATERQQTTHSREIEMPDHHQLRRN